MGSPRRLLFNCNTARDMVLYMEPGVGVSVLAMVLLARLRYRNIFFAQFLSKICLARRCCFGQKDLFKLNGVTQETQFREICFKYVVYLGDQVQKSPFQLSGITCKTQHCTICLAKWYYFKDTLQEICPQLNDVTWETQYMKNYFSYQRCYLGYPVQDNLFQQTVVFVEPSIGKSISTKRYYLGDQVQENLFQLSPVTCT